MENLDNATHKVVVTIGSMNDAEDVGVEVTFNPEMTGEDLAALGYQPAAHKFLDKFILPLLEQIYMKSNFPELFDEDGPDITVN